MIVMKFGNTASSLFSTAWRRRYITKEVENATFEIDESEILAIRKKIDFFNETFFKLFSGILAEYFWFMNISWAQN